jgi:hypothetical protein
LQPFRRRLSWQERQRCLAMRCERFGITGEPIWGTTLSPTLK